MNSWNQNQNQSSSNLVSGGINFNPNPNPYWSMQPQQFNRAPVYHAEPIHGENAAWAFPIGGGDIWLPDADQDIIWWIRIDQNGNKQVKSFDVKPHEEPKPVDMNEILARLSVVEEWINGKSNKSNAKRSATVPANAAAPTASSVE